MWRVVLTAIFIAVGIGAHAQIDARSLMNAQRQQQQGLGPNGLPGMGTPGNQGTQGVGADGQQLDANGNPIQNQGADTTKKERPRRPLESYFFSDSIRSLRNFQWHIDREYNTVQVEPVDTTLNVWRLDYPH